MKRISAKVTQGGGRFRLKSLLKVKLAPDLAKSTTLEWSARLASQASLATLARGIRGGDTARRGDVQDRPFGYGRISLRPNILKFFQLSLGERRGHPGMGLKSSRSEIRP